MASPSNKRRRVGHQCRMEERKDYAEEEQEQDWFEKDQHDQQCRAAIPHPYGVKPRGNSFLANRSQRNPREGLGTLSSLPDDLILESLSHMNACMLTALCQTSRALYVFASHEDLWRALTIRKFRGDFVFRTSWKQTFYDMIAQDKQSPSRSNLQPFQVEGLYSDVLYNNWHLCASSIPHEWVVQDNLPTCDAKISFETFRDTYETPNKPVLIKGLANNWPAMRKWKNKKYLTDNQEEHIEAFDEYAGSLSISLKNYFRYSKETHDERPLYVFEPNVAEKCPNLHKDIQVPHLFPQDHFAALGKKRPDYQWLLAGPERSGTNFHVDPNMTAAWNAVVSGRKKWILYPPHVLPPGITVSPTGQVLQPDSVTEWFSLYYGKDDGGESERLEGVAQPGDVLYIPSGWWHLVLNLEETVAYTQNYVSDANLAAVSRFLATRQPVYATFAGYDNMEAEFSNLMMIKQQKVSQKTDDLKAEKFNVKSTATSTTRSKPCITAPSQDHPSMGTFFFGF